MTTSPHRDQSECSEQSEYIEKVLARKNQSPGQREEPLARIVQLFRNPDARLRSRAALVVGRYMGYRTLLESRLQDENVRVRANTIESLWNVNNPLAASALVQASSDTNHRVRTNAIVGLYRLGEKERMMQLLAAQTTHESELFRSSAAWALGEIADPAAADCLKKMDGDPSNAVRLAAAAALRKLPAPAAATVEPPATAPAEAVAVAPDTQDAAPVPASQTASAPEAAESATA